MKRKILFALLILLAGSFFLFAKSDYVLSQILFNDFDKNGIKERIESWEWDNPEDCDHPPILKIIELKKPPVVWIDEKLQKTEFMEYPQFLELGLIDIDGDKVKELIILYGFCPGSTFFSAYKILKYSKGKFNLILDWEGYDLCAVNDGILAGIDFAKNQQNPKKLDLLYWEAVGDGGCHLCPQHFKIFTYRLVPQGYQINSLRTTDQKIQLENPKKCIFAKTKLEKVEVGITKPNQKMRLILPKKSKPIKKLPKFHPCSISA